jgi:mono/diheme cytochrome c family protein
MKKATIIISTFIFCCMLIFFSACNSDSSSRESELPSDSLTVEKGANLFFNKCSGCHNFNRDGIGPQLSGITAQQPISWIRSFIKDPKKMIDAGDTTAKKLFAKYKNIMPSFSSLGENDLTAILAFINTQKNHRANRINEDTNDIKNPIPDSIGVSDVVVGVKLITQVPPSSDQPPITRIIKLEAQPNTGDLFVLDLRGKLYKLVNGQPVVYMNIAEWKPKFISQPGLATGFGSFTFHPEFEKNGILYTTHTEPPASAKADFSYADSIPVMLQWVLTEWKTDPGAFPFKGKGREILRINLPTGIHGLQQISFNNLAKPGNEDYGLMYLGIGDGGSTEIGHPLVSPVPDRIWGSILRINPMGKNSRNGQYGIPSTNPFAKNENDVREIYAYGFRNPHRFSWGKSGQLFATTIGEHNIEALDIILPGHFYGWPIREGTFMVRFFNDVGKVYPLPANDSIYHVTYPVAQFDHDEGTAISGGFEYTGTAIPQLEGKYVFGDIGTGKLFFVNVKDLQLGKQAVIKRWNIALNGARTSLAELCNNYRVDLRFGMDNHGDLYLLTKQDGKVYKLVNR